MNGMCLINSIPRVLSCLVLLATIYMLLPSAHADTGEECVILLHGLGRTERSMNKIEDQLQDAGYRVWNAGYKSTKSSIPELSDSSISEGLGYCRNKQGQKIHFVTHSLGGILVRYYLQEHAVENLGRIVMLAPPNQGSEVADELRKFEWFGELLGPAALALGTAKEDIPKSLEPIPGEIGIIAGNSTSDPWFSPMIPGEDDGKVSVESTRLEEMRDFLIVPESHTFIMRDGEVIKQIMAFLREGKFSPLPPSRGSLDSEGQ